MSPSGGPSRSNIDRQHQVLVDALRLLLKSAAVGRDELGAAVRLQLGQDPVERPEKRISDLVTGSRFPTRRELDVIVRLCTGGSAAQRERFARLHEAAAAERQTRRAVAPPPDEHASANRAEALVEAPYRATVREIRSRTINLLGRRDELSAIDVFATGPPGYYLLVGAAYAGKTALLAEAALTDRNHEIAIVAYFMSRREADADANRFLAAVIPQLAEILHEGQPSQLDLHNFRAMWQRAASVVAAEGRNLLLIVDGLDEDLRPPGTPSVAAMLPTSLPTAAHVLVSSRPHPELPNDVSAGHPLRGARLHTLQAFAGSAELQALALQEIDQLKRRDADGLALAILGVLTAAAGPLTVNDLAALTAAPENPSAIQTRRVRQLIVEHAGRSLQFVGMARDGRRYQFAHGTLLEQAQADEDFTHPDYRSRIHNWAHAWQEAGWTAHQYSHLQAAPSYLLSEYLTTLNGDPARQQAISRDIKWSLAAINNFGVDRVLTDLRSVVRARPNDARTTAAYSAILAQAHHLRDATVATDPGLAARQLCLHALEVDEPLLAKASEDYLRSLPEPGLVPVWTTRSTSRSLQFELTRDATSMAVLDDGRIITGGSEPSGGHVLVWDQTNTDTSAIELGFDENGVDEIALLPDRRIVTGSRAGGRVIIWDPTRPDVAPITLGRVENGVGAIGVLRSGHVVTAAATRYIDDMAYGFHSQGTPDFSSGRILVWDPMNPGRSPVEVGREREGITALSVLADGRLATCGRGVFHPGGWIHIWDLDQRRDGVVEASADMWDLDLGQASKGVVQLGTDMNGINAISDLPDGRIITAGNASFDADEGGRLLVWDTTERRDMPIQIGPTAIEGMWSVVVLSDGRVLTGGGGAPGGGRILIWDPSNSETLPIELGRDEDGIGAIAALADGRVATLGRSGFGGDGRVLIWDPSRVDPTPQEHSKADVIRAFAMLVDGRVFTVGDSGWNHYGGGRVLIWDPAQPAETSIDVGSCGGAVSSIAVLPSQHVVTANHNWGTSGGRVLLWDPIRPEEAPVELGHDDDGVAAVAVMYDGRVATGGDTSNTVGRGGRVLLWDTTRCEENPIELGRDEHGERGVAAIVALPDNRIVTANYNLDRAGGGRLLIWDEARKGDPPVELGHFDGRVRSIAGLGDGSVIVGTDGGGDVGRVLVFDPSRPGSSPSEVCRDQRGLASLATLPDNRVAMAAGGWLRTWKLFDSTSAVSAVACAAYAVVARSGSTGAADFIVLHQGWNSWSGWSIVSSAIDEGEIVGPMQ